MPHSNAKILILEDDIDVAFAAQLLLKRHFGEVRAIHSPLDLIDALMSFAPDLVLLDMNYTYGKNDGSEGIAVIELIKSQKKAMPIIVLTAYADVALAVTAIKKGAVDFITKPWDNQRLVSAIQQSLLEPTQHSISLPSLNGKSPAMQRIKSIIAGVAPTDANVLILGENGVGKELVAQAIHRASKRAEKTMLTVDMGAIPDTTFESEMFGHRKGSFTDARASRAGRFQTANGGTLFLDEIGNLSLTSQAKLLTSLERREITPLGADKPEPIDVRIISATNVQESALFDPSVFRTDLIFRLNTIVIRIPPLRERKEDIPDLTQHWLTYYEQQYNKPSKSISEDCLSELCAFSWPGNVRSLRHACERAVILSQNVDYGFDDFGITEYNHASSPTYNEATSVLPLSAIEKDTVTKALQSADGNISKAAKALGLSRAALYRKLDKHGI